MSLNGVHRVDDEVVIYDMVPLQSVKLTMLTKILLLASSAILVEYRAKMNNKSGVFSFLPL